MRTEYSGERKSGQNKPFGGLGQNSNLRNNRGSYDANENRQRGGSSEAKKGGHQLKRSLPNDNAGSGDEDNDDQFIVGPESNHSMI